MDQIDWLPDALIIVDADGSIVQLNRHAETLFGWTREELVGQKIERLVPRAAGTNHAAARERYSRSASRQLMGPGRGSLSALRKDGTEFSVEVTLSPVSVGDRPYVVAAIRDTTVQERMRATLLHSSKLESLGQLAGGVAHDFNNLLTIIGGACELALANVRSGTSPIEDLGAILESHAKAKELVKQLLAFSRKQVLHPSLVDLNTVIAELGSMLKRLLGDEARLVHSLDPSPLLVCIDRSLLEQVVINLAVNARDAMPHGGVLTISTRNHWIDHAGSAVSATLAPGMYAEVVVADTGSGMDQATMARVFEPFFTTKGVGHGTGLGLATVLGFVSQCDGDISIESEPGRGTKFRILFPTSDGSEEAPRPPPNEEAAVDSKVVLVVDDNDVVRSIVGRVLRRRGFGIIVAVDGERALEILADAGRRIDLLLTDVVMPQMNGYQLAERARTLRPALSVLFMSGCAEGMAVERGPTLDGVDLIAKPFASDELLKKVDAALVHRTANTPKPE